VERSYAGLTQQAEFAELARRTVIAVSGPDRSSFLQSFTTNDIKRLTPGAGCEAFVTSPQGKTLGHVLVFCETDRIVLDTSPGQAQALIGHFERYVITEEIQFIDESNERGVILLAGPQAASVIENLSGSRAPELPLAHSRAVLAGCQLAIRRAPFAGCDSFLLESAATDQEAVAAALSAGGANACDQSTIDALRIEAGFPLFGPDITDENLPQEVARDKQTISFTKGCYLGQETVARIDALGHVNRLLRGVKFAGTSVPAAGTALLAAGQAVGKVTSAVWSPRLSAPLGLAYIRRQHAKAGTELTWDGGTAAVIDLPLGVPPEKSA
jgi:tRNA-modifying protein YgfZ